MAMASWLTGEGRGRKKSVEENVEFRVLGLVGNGRVGFQVRLHSGGMIPLTEGSLEGVIDKVEMRNRLGNI